MLFKKTICPQCKSDYDECLAYCPICHKENKARDPLINNKGPVWLRWELQIGLFLLGSIGFIAFTVMVGMFVNPIEDLILKLMLSNSIAYGILFAIMVVLMVVNRRNILDSLKDYKAYIIGILFGGALIGLSVLLEMFLGIWHESQAGGNQSAIILMVQNYPVVTFFIICVFGPICEEITYRIGLFTFFRRINRVLAYAVTILVFTLIHFDFTSEDLINELWNVPGYALGAIILTIAYDWKGPAASTACHIVNNLVSFISILLVANH